MQATACCQTSGKGESRVKSASVSSNSTLMPKPYRGRLKTENPRACFEARTLPVNLEIYVGYGLLTIKNS